MTQAGTRTCRDGRSGGLRGGLGGGAGGSELFAWRSSMSGVWAVPAPSPQQGGSGKAAPLFPQEAKSRPPPSVTAAPVHQSPPTSIMATCARLPILLTYRSTSTSPSDLWTRAFGKLIGGGWGWARLVGVGWGWSMRNPNPAVFVAAHPNPRAAPRGRVPSIAPPLACSKGPQSPAPLSHLTHAPPTPHEAPLKNSPAPR